LAIQGSTVAKEAIFESAFGWALVGLGNDIMKLQTPPTGESLGQYAKKCNGTKLKPTLIVVFLGDDIDGRDQVEGWLLPTCRLLPG
jgi:hypothetical protein